MTCMRAYVCPPDNTLRYFGGVESVKVRGSQRKKPAKMLKAKYENRLDIANQNILLKYVKMFRRCELNATEPMQERKSVTWLRFRGWKSFA